MSRGPSWGSDGGRGTASKAARRPRGERSPTRDAAEQASSSRRRRPGLAATDGLSGNGAGTNRSPPGRATEAGGSQTPSDAGPEAGTERRAGAEEGSEL